MGFDTTLLIFQRAPGNTDYFNVGATNRQACFETHLWKLDGLVIELGRMQLYEPEEIQSILCGERTPANSRWLANQILLTSLLPFWKQTMARGDMSLIAPRFLQNLYALEKKQITFQPPPPEKEQHYVALPLERDQLIYLAAENKQLTLGALSPVYRALYALFDRAKRHNQLLEENRVAEAIKKITHPWCEAPCMWVPPPLVADAIRSMEQEFPLEWSLLQKCPAAGSLVNGYCAFFDQLNGEDFRIMLFGH